MKINGNIPNNIGKLYKNQEKVAPQKKEPAIKTREDKLEISSEAKQIQELVQKTKDLPEVREAKINEIKDQIKNNTYHVSPEQLAAKMLSKNRI